MNRSIFLYLYLVCALGTVQMACSGDNTEDINVSGNDGNKNPLTVCLQTRANEAVVTDVQAGLYMVCHKDGKALELAEADNYVDNTSMTYSGGAWMTEQTIYWADINTTADFYAYVPYCADVQNARKHVFSVATDQTEADAFTRSDFLWGKLVGQQPTDETLSLSLSHILSHFTVIVTSGNGFADGELNAGNVSVTLCGLIPSATIDIANGSISPVGTVQDIKCHNNGNLTYTAIIIPQKIPFTNLIRIDYNGTPYIIQNSFVVESGRQYTITLKLNKLSNGLNVGISGWDIVEEDFGGTAE